MSGSRESAGHLSFCQAFAGRLAVMCGSGGLPSFWGRCDHAGDAPCHAAEQGGIRRADTHRLVYAADERA